MTIRVRNIMVPLSEYAVVDESATIRDALVALRDSQTKLAPDRQPHRAVLVRNRLGRIVGKVHHFAFLRAMVAERKPLLERNVLDRAGVGDDLRESSMRMLDLLTGNLVDFRERAGSVAVRDVYTAASVNVSEDATIADAISMFLTQHTLSLLVGQGTETVGILRLSDLVDELSRQILADETGEDGESR